jgi:transitional endoplasmic reticulum ATPase
VAWSSQDHLTGLAAITEGATGVDLREIVRRGVLEHGAALSAAHLAEIVGTSRWKPVVPTGQYL